MLNPDPYRKRLKAILERRGEQVLQQFKKITVANTSNSELTAIFEDVNKYWKDLHRPSLAAFSSEAVGGQPSIVNDASLMITLASAGMGIHDDIIDKSENKHLRRTIVGKYGENKALLAGDLLIIKGLAITQARLEKTFPNAKREAVLVAIWNFIFEIYDGELMDISCRKNLDTDLDKYLEILWRLAADGEACSRVGAILGGGSEIEVTALAEFGRRLGLIIILGEEVRDVLNIEGNLMHRMKYESAPLPVLFAAKSSEQVYSELEVILENPITATQVFKIMELCCKTRAISYVYKIAKKNARQALAELRLLKHSPARETLALMIDVALRDLRKARNFETQYAEFASR